MNFENTLENLQDKVFCQAPILNFRKVIELDTKLIIIFYLCLNRPPGDLVNATNFDWFFIVSF